MLGLPDLQPVHDIYLDQVKSVMAKGITPDLVQTVVKNWVPMGEAGLGLVQGLMGQLGGSLRNAGSSAAKQAAQADPAPAKSADKPAASGKK